MRFSVGKVHHALFSDNTVLTVGIYYEGSLAFLMLLHHQGGDSVPWRAVVRSFLLR
jgi:hypothetical protein